jgi:hypothetical protein
MTSLVAPKVAEVAFANSLLASGKDGNLLPINQSSEAVYSFLLLNRDPKYKYTPPAYYFFMMLRYAGYLIFTFAEGI